MSLRSAGHRSRPRLAVLAALTLLIGACAGPAPVPPGAEGSDARHALAATDGSSPGGESPGEVTLAFGGDVHFEEYVAALLDRPDDSLADLRSTLGAADFSMVNLETAITTGGTPENKSFLFRAPPTALRALHAAGIDAVSLANNHAVDYGAGGLADTLAAKADSPIPMVGIGKDAHEAYAPAYVDVGGLRIALLAALQLWEETATRHSAADGQAGVATSHTPPSLALLREATRAAAASADLVVVMMHWGTEYATCADAAQAATMAALRDDGADVIVGGHAHRLQGGGWSGRSYVGYSLGNFVWWRSAEPEARSGVLTLTVDADAARRRGQAEGTARTTATSLITRADWQPLLIGTDGVPRPPDDPATLRRLQGVWDTAVACSGLATTPPA